MAEKVNNSTADSGPTGVFYAAGVKDRGSDKFKNNTQAATDFVKSDFDRATMLDNPHTDNLMTALLNLGAETWVIRRRQMISETLAAKKVMPTSAAIDAYNPTDAEEKLLKEERDIFIDRIFSVLTRPAVKIAGAPPTLRNAKPYSHV